MTITAPGKLFFAGEYGVLDGGTAVVAAVDRRVVARFVPGAAPSTPVVAEAIAAVRSHCATTGASLPDGAPEIDSASLSHGGRKLGLGSSAAVAAAAVGVVAGGGRLRRRGGEAAHLPAGRSRPPRRAGGPRLGRRRRRRSLGWRPRLHPAGGRHAERARAGPAGPAHAGDRVRPGCRARPSIMSPRRRAAGRARSGSARAPPARDRGAPPMRSLLGYERAMPRRCCRRSAPPTKRSWRSAASADLPIVTPELAAAAALARELGGAAKPSGAGGGDVGVAFFSDPDSAAAFRDAGGAAQSADS